MLNVWKRPFLLPAMAVAAVIYGLLVLWYVPTQPVVPLGCLLQPSQSRAEHQRGLVIRDVSLLENVACKGYTPEVGDRLIEVAGRPIYSFTDWVRVHRTFRRLQLGSEAMVESSIDPTEERNLGDLSIVQYPDRTRFVKVWFTRPGESEARLSFIPLIAQPTLGVSIALVWFVLQMLVVTVGGVAFWNRPQDQPVRTFFALSSVALVAFVGGSHWWVISSSPLLITLFAVAGTLMPATLLHFLVVYPFAPRFYRQHRTLSLWAIYAIPTTAACLLGSSILLAWVMTADVGQGPFAVTVERMSSEAVAAMLPFVRMLIHCVLGVSVCYFLACVVRLSRSYQLARNPLEQSQVRWILAAAVFAVIPIAYTIYLGYFDNVRFALGAARVPMFLASLAFMFAYGIGIARYKLMLIDQVVSRGVWYYGSSVALAIVFSALIAVGVVNAQPVNLAILGQTVPLVLVLMTSILVLIWCRDTIQRILDRNFFSEKYQLDKALRRMNRVVSDVLEPEAVSASLLDSCREVLHVDNAALYLRKQQSNEFRMLIASGQSAFPLQFHLTEDASLALDEHRVLQRVPQSESPAQQFIRLLHAEVVHGLEIQDRLAGVLVLGAKPNHASYRAEDIAYVTAMGRTTALALHCATVQQNLSRLNRDLQLKIEKIEDQDRQLNALRQEVAALASAPVEKEKVELIQRTGIIGQGPAISEVLDTVRKVATTQSSVLIRGESGTGKELLARCLHDNSPRHEGPLVSVHCAALSSTLLESELFGHVKGAFTDAREDKIGRFQMASGGTLFLDEIGDISSEVQVKLLRVLQERTFEPVGGTKSISVDVRLIAATHRNLEELIAQGKFREDLFYRLNVISVTLPPLRERREDLADLIQHFLKVTSEKIGKRVLRVDPEALETMHNYPWPGNIRELQNVIERAVVLADSSVITRNELAPEVINPTPKRVLHSTAEPAPAMPDLNPSRSGAKLAPDEERVSLQQALDRCRGNKAEAARLLNMPRSTFFSKLKKYDLA